MHCSTSANTGRIRPNGQRMLIRTGILVGLSCLLFPPKLTGGPLGEPDREGIEFFETKIRPVLVERCYTCHSSQAEKVKSGLLLDTRVDVLKGGTRGPAIVPGD